MAAVKIIGKVAVKVMPDTSKFKDELRQELDKIEKSVGPLEIEIIPKITAAEKKKVREELNRLQKELSGKNIDFDLGLNNGDVARIDGLISGLARTRSVKVEVRADDKELTVFEGLLDFVTRDRTVNIDVDYHAINALMMLAGVRPQIEAWQSMFDMAKNLDNLAISAATSATKLGALSIAAVGLSGSILTLGGDIAAIGPAALALPGIFGGIALGTIAWAVAMKDFNKHFSQFQVGLGRATKAGAAWKDLQDSMSSNFWAKAEKPMGDFIKNIFPQFSAGMRSISTDLGTFTGALSASLNGQFNGALAGMFDNLGKSIRIATGGTDALAQIVRILGETGANYLPSLAQWFVKITTQFSNFLSKAQGDGSLRSWIDTGITNLKALGSVLGSVGGILRTFYQSASGGGIGGLVNLADQLNKIQATVQTPAFKNGLTSVFASAHTALDSFFNAAGPGLKALALAFRDLFTNVAPNLGATLGSVVGALGQALSSPAISNGLTALFDGIQGAAKNLVPTFQPLATILGSLGPVLGALVKNITAFGAAGVDKLAPVIQGLAAALVPVIEKLGALLTGIGQQMAPVFAVLGTVLTKAVQHLGPLIDAVGSLWKLIGPVLVPILKIVVKIIGDSLIAVITGVTMVFKGVTKIIQGVVDVFKGLWDIVSGIFTLDFSKIGDGIGKVFGGLGKIIVGALQGAAGALWAWMNASVLAPFKTLGLKLLGPIGKLFAPLGKAFGGLSKLVSGYLKPFFSWIVRGSEDGVKAIGGVWSRITDVFKFIFEPLIKVIEPVFKAIKAVVGAYFKVIGIVIKTYVTVWKTIFSTAWDVIRVVFKTALDIIVVLVKSVVGGIKAAWTGITEFFATTMNAIYMTFKGPWDAISGFLTGLWTTIGGAIKLAWNGIRDFFGLVFNVYIRGIIENAWTAITGVFTKTWETIRGIFTKALDAIKSFISTRFDNIKTNVGNVWGWIRDKIGNVWDGIRTKVSNVLGAVKDFISSRFDNIKTNVGNVWGWIKDKIGGVWDGIRDKVSGAVGTIKDKLSSAWTTIKTAVSDAWDSVKSTIGTKITDVVDAVGKLPTKAKNALAGIGTVLIDAGKHLIQGFIDGISSMFDSVKNKLGDLTHKLTSWKGPESLDKVLLTPAGQMVIEGFVRGLESRYDVVRKSLNGLTDDVASQFDNGNQYKVGITTALDTSATDMSAVKGLSSKVNASISSDSSADTGNVQIDNITIPLDDLEQLKTLEDFIDMLRVRIKQGTLA